MPTYAILGATGNCGSALIELLLKAPDTTIHAYVRNRPKLEKMMPAAVADPRLRVFAGSVSDVALMTDCLRGCHAVFVAASTNTNVPGCRVGQDCATAIIAALRVLHKADPAAPVAKVVVLSSASIDPHLARNMSWWFKPIMLRAGHYVYEDLKVQEKMLRAEDGWLTSIFIKPGGLSVDKQRGHRLDFENEDTFLSYLDLSAAMIEAADDPNGHYDMTNVSVVNTNGGAKVPLGTPGCIFFGLIRYYLPSLHPYLPTPGP